MMNFAPPPSLDTLSQNVKHGDFDPSTGQIIRSTQTKKKKKQKPPLESYKVHIGIGITPEGRVEYRFSEGLGHLAAELLKRVSETLSQLAQAQQFEDDHIAARPQKAFRRADDGYKTTSWQNQPHCSPEDPYSCGPSPYLSQMASKRRRVGSPPLQSQDMAMSEFGANQSFVPTHGPPSVSRLDNASVPNAPVNRPQVGIRLDDEAKWLEWFENAFLAIQQQACRLIAKEWIKAIHPKKQSTNPYNGNFPRNQQADPAKTRPKYWPPHVQHREPDHINKESRTQLLIHLLMNTPQEELAPNPGEGGVVRNYLVAADLLETLAKKKDELKDKWEIIQEVIGARTKLEAFKEGGYDPETVVYVSNYNENNRSGAHGKKQRTKSKADTKADANAASICNDVDEMYAGSPNPPVSPVNSMPTPDDSERDEDISAMNASFSSTATQTSTRSTVPILRPKPAEPSNNQSHVNTQPVEQHQMLVETEQAYSGADLKQQDQMHAAWATVNVPGSQMHELYTNGGLLQPTPIQATENTYFGQEMYGMPHQVPMHGMGPHMGYHPSQLFPCDYGQGMNRGAYLRDMPDLHEMGSTQDYHLHDQYARIHAQAQHSHQ